MKDINTIENLSSILRESVERIAYEFDEPDDDWIPVMGLVPEDGDNVMLALDYQWFKDDATKDKLVNTVMVPAITGVGAKTVGTVFSVWAAVPDPDVPIEEMVRPSEAENRTEAVLVTVMDSFNIRTWMIPINRFEEKPPTLGEWQEFPGNAYSGRFVEDVQAALRDSSGKTNPAFMKLLSEQGIELED